jgi:hypothetical protein
VGGVRREGKAWKSILTFDGELKKGKGRRKHKLVVRGHKRRRATGSGKKKKKAKGSLLYPAGLLGDQM